MHTRTHTHAHTYNPHTTHAHTTYTNTQVAAPSPAAAIGWCGLLMKCLVCCSLLSAGVELSDFSMQWAASTLPEERARELKIRAR